MRGLPVALAFLSTLCAAGAQTAPPSPVAPLGDGIAHRTVSTVNAGAQRAFDEGLTLLYAFNYDEARRRFAEAARLDPHLAMARWGIAMSHGININSDFDPAAERSGLDALTSALRSDMNATPVERALIDAAAKRFAFHAKGDADRSAHAYDAAMTAVAVRYPNDDDVQALSAEAAMDVAPWDYWDAAGKPGPFVHATLERLQAVLARNPAHIQANHLLIHLLEESPHPEEALASADHLAAMAFAPGDEHLAHMPAHAYMRAGRYHEAGLANTRGLDLFDAYLAGDHAPGHEPYRPHDCKFAVVAYMMSGERVAAEHDADRCDRDARTLHDEIAIRFRRLETLGAPSAQSHLAHGLNAVAAGKLDAAESDARLIDRAEGEVAKVSAAVLRAAIARRRGSSDDEIAILTRAVAVQDAEGYSEPPRYFFPVRESLGGAYLRAGKPAEAERVFRADLARNPENPRSLFGLSAALERQGRVDEAARAKAAFEHAWRWADATLDINVL